NMQERVCPEFEMRHRMSLALEYGSVSINEMAAHLDISRTTVSNYLHGRTQPRRGDLIAWAMRCGVPFEWLVGSDADSVIEEVPKPAKQSSKPPVKGSTKSPVKATAKTTKTATKTAKTLPKPRRSRTA